MDFSLMEGDCLDQLRTLPNDSVHSIVTDPPYGLSFMGKKWDYDVPSVETWRECLRVLKPGGYLLSFGGTRTYHRMAVAIEDAGFEIRDQIQWLYGSGFPKSLDVSKAIDKAAGQDAKQWQGWGTALKPANEPICLARKPISEKTVAANVLKHGTGAINIDGCRVEGVPRATHGDKNIRTNRGGYDKGRDSMPLGESPVASGRWPANLILDDEAAKVLDKQTGDLGASRFFKVIQSIKELNANRKNPSKEEDPIRFFYQAKASKSERNKGCEGLEKKDPPGSKRSTPAEGRSSALGAPRENFHPTVKPVKLMQYLCKLITPPGGTVLDPFMGSGSTGVAAIKEKFKFIGIEREKEYLDIARARIQGAVNGRR